MACACSDWLCDNRSLTAESVQCEGPASIIVTVREEIEGVISEGPNSGELVYDAGEPADDPPLGEIVCRRDFSASWYG